MSSDHNGNSFRFLGLTQMQFMVWLSAAGFVAAMVVILLLSLSLREAYSEAKSAREIARNSRVIVVENKTALCGMKVYAQEQVENTADFLAKNTKPEPIPGVPRSLLVSQLERQRDFRDTLQGLDCPDPEGGE